MKTPFPARASPGQSFFHVTDKQKTNLVADTLIKKGKEKPFVIFRKTRIFFVYACSKRHVLHGEIRSTVTPLFHPSFVSS